MKVLEHGWVYNEKHNIVKCRCGCKYKYDEEDVKEAPQVYLEDFDLKCRYYLNYYVECPECGGRKVLAR